MKAIVGEVAVRCPECEAEIPIQVDFELSEPAEDGTVRARTEPDLTEVWAHAWTHEERGGVG